MTTLSPAERTRLVGVLGLLSSDFAGERAAAGLLATKMLRDRGLCWSDLIADQTQAAITTRGAADPTNDFGLCLKHIDKLTAWEIGFLRSLARARRRSAKQLAVVSRIAETLRARGLD